MVNIRSDELFVTRKELRVADCLRVRAQQENRRGGLSEVVDVNVVVRAASGQMIFWIEHVSIDGISRGCERH